MVKYLRKNQDVEVLGLELGLNVYSIIDFLGGTERVSAFNIQMAAPEKVTVAGKMRYFPSAGPRFSGSAETTRGSIDFQEGDYLVKDQSGQITVYDHYRFHENFHAVSDDGE